MFSTGMLLQSRLMSADIIVSVQFLMLCRMDDLWCSCCVQNLKFSGPVILSCGSAL